MQVEISKDLIDSIYNFFNEKPFEKEFRSDSDINYKNYLVLRVSLILLLKVNQY